MKKIAIITLVGYKNYGNRLQNFAVQEVLRSLGYSVETLVFNEKNDKLNKTNPLKKVMNLNFKKVFDKLKFYIHKNSLNNRTKLFREFTNEYIVERDYNISDVHTKLGSEYDYFVTGSDQVWNPYYIKNKGIYFLTFAPKPKRIAYSPSLGIASIPHEFREDYKTWIDDINGLSIREEAGANIIKDLTGRDACVLVDPTLMITKEKWISISKMAKHKPKNRFLLTYFLGALSNENKRKIKGIATKHDLEIVNLYDMRDPKTFETCPSEFIDYVNSASIFCTDSFHGVIFSILLEKPFFVFERNSKAASMYSRIETLLYKFQLEARKSRNIKMNGDDLKIDYSHIPRILENERKKTLAYLEQVITL